MMWHLHKWGKWSIQTFIVSGLFMDPHPQLLQVRTCDKCNKTQTRSL